MTITVRERRSEIGLLRAMGSGERQILALFLSEAILISILGGLAGLALLAVIIAVCILALPALPLAINPGYLLLALLVSGLIGLLAGVAPARRAAKLDPVQALRAE